MQPENNEAIILLKKKERKRERERERERKKERKKEIDNK